MSKRSTNLNRGRGSARLSAANVANLAHALGITADDLRKPLPAETCEVCDEPLGAFVEETDFATGQMVKVCLRCADRELPNVSNDAEDRYYRSF
jgi:hypothetical protein